VLVLNGAAPPCSVAYPSPTFDGPYGKSQFPVGSVHAESSSTGSGHEDTLPPWVKVTQ
jgi:hypothetical protein